MNYDQNNPYGQPQQDNPYGQPQQANPYGQPYNPYGQPVQPAQPQSSKVLAVLSFVFSLINILFFGIGMGLAFDREESGVFFIVLALILCILAVIFGIIGLVKGIKARSAGGIVFASIGLCFSVVEVFIYFTGMVEAIDYLDRVSHYYYNYY